MALAERVAGYIGTMAGLPMGLWGPVQVALARTREDIPGEQALPGGSMYELKWDGFRCALVRDGTVIRLWSRQGKDLTDHFPDVARAATAQVPSGTVLDGELVIWNGDRLDFDLLQRRLVIRGKRAAALAVEHPASFVAFDVLAAGGRDMRPLPLRERRAILETLPLTGRRRCRCPPSPPARPRRGRGSRTTARQGSRGSSSRPLVGRTCRGGGTG